MDRGVGLGRGLANASVSATLNERHGSENTARVQAASNFLRTILPVVAKASKSTLARETGLSVNYCATIKAGKHTPHSRHWEGLLRAAQE